MAAVMRVERWGLWEQITGSQGVENNDPSVPIRTYRMSRHDSKSSCEHNSVHQRNKGRPDDLPKVSGKDKQAAGARCTNSLKLKKTEAREGRLANIESILLTSRIET